MRIFFSTFLFLLGLWAAPVDNTLLEENLHTFNTLKKKIPLLIKDPKQRKISLILINKIETLLEEDNLRTPMPIPRSQKNLLTFVHMLSSDYTYIELLKSRLKDASNRAKKLKNTIEERKDHAEDLWSLQLAFAYNIHLEHKTQKEITERIQELQDAYKTVLEALSTLDFDLNSAHITIQKLQEKRKDQFLAKDRIEVDMQQYALMVDQINIERLNQAMRDLTNAIVTTTKELINAHLIIYAQALKEHSSRQSFNTTAEIRSLADSLEKLIPSDDPLFYLHDVLNACNIAHFGKVKLVAQNTKESFIMLAQEVWFWLNEPFYKNQEISFSAMKLIIILLIFIMGLKIGRYYKHWIIRLKTHPKLALTNSASMLLSNLGYYFIVLIFLIISLKVSGIDLTSLTIFASALSIGIGFGLQAIVSNFVSGIILLFENSLRIGDYIEVSDTVIGKITNIRMRATTILTFDNTEVIVPNQSFIQNNVTTWTLSDPYKRLKIPFGVAYGTDPALIDTVIIEAVEGLSYDFVRNDPDRKLECVMTELGDSSVNFELRIYKRMGKDNPLNPTVTVDVLLRTIYQTLNKHNIAIPFPQRDITIRHETV